MCCKKMQTSTTKVPLVSHPSPWTSVRIKWDNARISINTEWLIFDTLTLQSLIQSFKEIRTKWMDLAGISTMYYRLEKERSRSSVHSLIPFLQNSAMHVYVYSQTTLFRIPHQAFPLLPTPTQVIILLFCFIFPHTIYLLLCLLLISSH